MKLLDLYFENFCTIVLKFNWLVFLALIIGGYLIALLIKHILKCCCKHSIVVDEMTLGIGDSTVTLKYDDKDKEIAYKLWVELNTRKIGIDFDEDNDVIVEIYNSWYDFFKVSRELIKEIPARKIKYTSELIELSTDILNKGLRPHLTKWQAMFRKWYNLQLGDAKNDEKSPQTIQREYDRYTELVSELKETNKKMIEYKNLMYRIAFK